MCAPGDSGFRRQKSGTTSSSSFMRGLVGDRVGDVGEADMNVLNRGWSLGDRAGNRPDTYLLADGRAVAAGLRGWMGLCGLTGPRCVVAGAGAGIAKPAEEVVSRSRKRVFKFETLHF